MSEELPGLAQLRAMLGASDNSQLIVRGMSIIVAAGTFYVVSTEALYGDAPPLPQSQVEANIAPIGAVALTAPPAAPAPAVEAAPAVEETAPVAEPAAVKRPMPAWMLHMTPRS